MQPDDDMVFSFRSSRDGKVFIAWRGRVVTTLAGDTARRFLTAVEHETAAEAQLRMARATGNFKRGNEGGR